jgi:hypothetical protein
MIPGIGRDRVGELLRYRWELLMLLREQKKGSF